MQWAYAGAGCANPPKAGGIEQGRVPTESRRLKTLDSIPASPRTLTLTLNPNPNPNPNPNLTPNSNSNPNPNLTPNSTPTPNPYQR